MDEHLEVARSERDGFEDALAEAQAKLEYHAERLHRAEAKLAEVRDYCENSGEPDADDRYVLAILTRDEPAPARSDTERLDWLEGNHGGTSGNDLRWCWVVDMNGRISTYHPSKRYGRPNLRFQIDAAIDAEEGQGVTDPNPPIRYPCFECGRSVTSELPHDSVIRAVLICPDCVGASEMRVLMVLVNDGIISSGRAREIIDMPIERQRQFWRDEHAATMAHERAEGRREALEEVQQAHADNRLLEYLRALAEEGDDAPAPLDIDWDQLEDHTPPDTYRPEHHGRWLDGETLILPRPVVIVYVSDEYL